MWMNMGMRGFISITNMWMHIHNIVILNKAKRRTNKDVQRKTRLGIHELTHYYNSKRKSTVIKQQDKCMQQIITKYKIKARKFARKQCKGIKITATITCKRCNRWHAPSSKTSWRSARQARWSSSERKTTQYKNITRWIWHCTIAHDSQQDGPEHHHIHAHPVA